MYKQKGTAARSRLGPGAAVPRRAVLSVPWCARTRRAAEEGSRAGASPCALREAKDGGLIVIEFATLEAAETKALIGIFTSA